MYGGKEMFAEDREYEMQHQDTSYDQLMEEMEHMQHRRFCTQCNTNWSALHRTDEDGDEQYEYCPTCRTAEFLETGRSGETFNMSPITGQVINDLSGIPRFIATAPPPAVPKTFSPFTTNVAKKDVLESLEDQALDAYQVAFTKGGQTAGEEAYRAELKRQNRK